MDAPLPPAPAADYDFELPPEAVAQRPATPRDAARMLWLPLYGGDPVDGGVADLPGRLRAGDLLVRNDTRVIPARLLGKRGGGGKTEFLLIHALHDREAPDVRVDGAVWDALAPVSADGAAETPTKDARVDDDTTVWHRWLCLARPAGHLKPGAVVRFSTDGADGQDWTAVMEARLGGGKIVAAFPVPRGERFGDWLARAGRVPLPPYIARADAGPDADDRARYQTLYAARDGAVAAPTAGLHFTPGLDAALRGAGVEFATVTLHVGPGTFRPVAVDDLNDHRLDAEYFEIPRATVRAVARARARGGRVVAVGTTTARALESAADILSAHPEDGEGVAASGWTTLFVKPGYRWRVVDGLLTNFHLPRSTLLALVASLAGRERVLAAYRRAVAAGYRFYSYGDAMLVL